MKFEEAIIKLKEGYKIRRPQWYNLNKMIYWEPMSMFQYYVDWRDVIAEDWEASKKVI